MEMPLMQNEILNLKDLKLPVKEQGGGVDY